MKKSRIDPPIFSDVPMSAAGPGSSSSVGTRPARVADRAVMRQDGAGPPPGRPSRVLLAVPESDAHVVANTLLEYFLKQRGCPVLNLGACTPAADIAAAARDFAPDAILISSHNGHAFDDLRALPEAMAAAGAGHVPVYLGGNLSVGADKQLTDTTRFRALGIRVVTSFEAIDEILRLPPAAEGNGDATAR